MRKLQSRKRKIRNVSSSKKVKCRGCGSSLSVIKWWIIADDLENPKPYHASCMRKLKTEIIMKLSDTTLQQV